LYIKNLFGDLTRKLHVASRYWTTTFKSCQWKSLKKRFLTFTRTILTSISLELHLKMLPDLFKCSNSAVPIKEVIKLETLCSLIAENPNNRKLFSEVDKLLRLAQRRNARSQWSGDWNRTFARRWGKKD
jgi:hypothetical protein